MKTTEEKAKEIAKIVSNINENILDKVQVYEETKNGKVYFWFLKEELL